jgi:hypothetical protein
MASSMTVDKSSCRTTLRSMTQRYVLTVAILVGSALAGYAAYGEWRSASCADRECVRNFRPTVESKEISR